MKIAGAIVAVLAVLVLIGMMLPDTGDEIGALVKSQTFVKRRLKAPGSAEFPYITDEGVQVEAVAGSPGEFLVRAYVDSQNAFGATLRMAYVCRLRYKGDGQWELLELVTDEDVGRPLR